MLADGGIIIFNHERCKILEGGKKDSISTLNGGITEPEYKGYMRIENTIGGDSIDIEHKNSYPFVTSEFLVVVKIADCILTLIIPKYRLSSEDFLNMENRTVGIIFSSVLFILPVPDMLLYNKYVCLSRIIQ